MILKTCKTNRISKNNNIIIEIKIPIDWLNRRLDTVKINKWTGINYL